MIKKILLIVLLVFTTIITICFTIFLKKQIHSTKQIFTHRINTDNIENSITYKDEFVKLNNVIALQKNVKIYQWVEDNNTYTKQWVDKKIDSSQFVDKSKNNNCNTNTYTSKNIVIDKIITKHNLIIKQSDFITKIRYTPLVFNTKFLYGLSTKINNNIDKNATYTDLDSYVSSIDNKVIHAEKDKFNVVNGDILYSGVNYNNPEICDIKITYKYFSSKNITFLNSNIVDFYRKNIIKLIIFKRITFLAILLVVVNIIVFCVKIILIMLQKIPDFTLQYIPFFNEYFVYSQNIYFNTFCISSILLCITGGYWVFGIISLMLLIVAREIDYYGV